MSYRILHIFRTLRRVGRTAQRAEAPSAFEGFHLLRMGASFGPYGIAAALTILSALELYHILYPPETELHRYERLFGETKGKAMYMKEFNEREVEKDWIGKS